MKVGGWLFLGVVLFGRAGLAAEPTRPLIDIHAAGAAEPVALLEARTRELLQSFPVGVRWARLEHFRPREVLASPSDAALARIWVDVGDPRRAVLYVVDDTHERFLVRVVPLDAGFDEVACESLGTILQSSVEALLAGAALGVSRIDAEEQLRALEANAPAPPVSSAPPPESVKPPAPQKTYQGRAPRLAWAFELAYRGQLVTTEPVAVHGPEVGVLVRDARAPWFWIAALDVGYRAPITWTREGLGARLEGFGVRGGLGLGRRFGSRLRSAAYLLGGLDGFEVAPVANPEQRDGSAVGAPFRIAAPTLGAAVEAELVFQRASVWLTVGAEADLLGHHYQIIRDGTRESWLEPGSLQGVLRGGLRFFP